MQTSHFIKSCKWTEDYFNKEKTGLCAKLRRMPGVSAPIGNCL